MIVKINEGYNSFSNSSYLRPDFVMNPIFESRDSMTAYLQECGIFTEGIDVKKFISNLAGSVGKIFDTVIGFIRGLIEKAGRFLREKAGKAINAFKNNKDIKTSYDNWVKNGGLDNEVTVNKNMSLRLLESQYKKLEKKISISKSAFNSAMANILKQSKNGDGTFDTDSAVFTIFKSEDSAEFSNTNKISENNDQNEDITVKEFFKRMGIGGGYKGIEGCYLKLDGMIKKCESLNESIAGIRKDICGKITNLERDTGTSAAINVGAVLRKGVQEWASGYKTVATVLLRNIRSLSDTLVIIADDIL